MPRSTTMARFGLPSLHLVFASAVCCCILAATTVAAFSFQEVFKGQWIVTRATMDSHSGALHHENIELHYDLAPSGSDLLVGSYWENDTQTAWVHKRMQVRVELTSPTAGLFRWRPDTAAPRGNDPQSLGGDDFDDVDAGDDSSAAESEFRVLFAFNFQPAVQSAYLSQGSWEDGSMYYHFMFLNKDAFVLTLTPTAQNADAEPITMTGTRAGAASQPGWLQKYGPMAGLGGLLIFNRVMQARMRGPAAAQRPGAAQQPAAARAGAPAGARAAGAQPSVQGGEQAQADAGDSDHDKRD